jgi:hypothetical protein
VTVSYYGSSSFLKLHGAHIVLKSYSAEEIECMSVAQGPEIKVTCWASKGSNLILRRVVMMIQLALTFELFYHMDIDILVPVVIQHDQTFPFFEPSL